jgi:effector-binding domain-containing protein
MTSMRFTECGRLRLIESETTMPITDVEVKTIAAQRVLNLHTRVTSDDDPGVEPLFERVIEHMEAVHADRSAPISWRETNGDVVYVYAGFIAPTSEVPGLEVVVLPEVRAASVVRRGAVHGINEAHQVLARWAEAQGHTASVERGRWRELYLETDDNDYSDWLIEVQLELTGNADRS